MGCAMFAAAGTCLAADPPAQPVERPVRSYSGRVQLHAMPTEIRLPEAESREKISLTDSIPMDAPRLSDTVPSGTYGPFVTPPPRREREREREKDKKSRNWILPPDLGATDKKDGAQKREGDEGWGWLANDVLEQQRADQEEDGGDESDELDLSVLPTERLMRQASGASGLLTDTSYLQPTPVVRARAPAGIDVRAMMVMDEKAASAAANRNMQSSTPDQPPAAGSIPAGLPAGPATTPLDVSPAGGSPWAPDTRRENVLPQTTTLMGSSKPEASGMSALLPDRSGGLPKSGAPASPIAPPPTSTRPPSMTYSFESSAGSAWGQMPAASPGRGVFGALESPRPAGSGMQPAGGLGTRSAFGSMPSQQGFSTTPAQSFPEPSSTIPSWRR